MPQAARSRLEPAPVAFAVALALNAVIFAVLLTLVPTRWETNDDFEMLRMSSGMMTGEPSEYLVFSNILVGRVLKQLYRWRADVPWYGVHLYAAHFLAMTGLLYAFLRRSPRAEAMLLFLLLFLFFELPLLLQLQFTSTAIVTVAAGICLLLLNGGRDRPWLAAICGTGLIVLGALIRHEASVLAAGILTPLVAYQIMTHRSFRTLFWLALAGGLVVAAARYDEGVYRRSSAWSAFLDYNAVRSPIHDTPLVRYEEQRIFFNRIGWSENDLRAFELWFLCDKGFYSAESLKTINAALSPTIKARKDWPQYLAANLFVQEKAVAVTLTMLLLAAFLAAGDRWRVLLVAAMTVAVSAAAFSYLSMYSKFPPRIAAPSLLVLNLAFCFQALSAHGATSKLRGGLFGYDVRLRLLGALSAAPTGTTRGRRLPFRVELPITSRGIAALLIVTLLGSHLLHASRAVTALSHLTRRQQEQFDDMLTTIDRNIVAKNPEAVFAVGGGSFPYRWMSPLDSGDRIRRFRLMGIGWSTHSPSYEQTLSRYGITDLTRALVENPNVYLILAPGEREERIPRYYAEHFGEDILLERRAEIDFPTGIRDFSPSVLVVKPRVISAAERARIDAEAAAAEGAAEAAHDESEPEF